MAATVQDMLDHFEISRLVSEYCHAVDRCDEPAMAGTYSADSWDDHGHRSGNGVDFARMIMEGMRDNRSVSHLQGQTLVKVDADEAGAETYFLAVIRADDAEGKETLHQLGGRFVDRLVREDGGWKIKHRTAIRDWSITLPMDQDWIAMQGLKEGRRSNADPSFAALGITHSGIPDDLTD